MSLEKALNQREQCLNSVEQAKLWLQRAQNEIAMVRGDGSCEIYSKLADIYYDELNDLLTKIRKMQPTGLDGEGA